MKADLYRNITVATDGPTATITMNRPEKRNALSLQHMRELIEALRAVGKRSAGFAQTQVVVLAGAGPAFCAGHDLAEIREADEPSVRETFDACVELMTALLEIPQPVIARVHGIATAAGCQLVATCDLAVASESASFATPGVKIGLFCSTPMVALSRNVGRKRAMEMLLTGEALSAREALSAGLVNRVVDAERLDDAVQELALKIASFSPAVVSLGKRAFYQQADLPVVEAYALTKEVMIANAALGDAREGISAFLEKRAPHWTDKE